MMIQKQKYKKLWNSYLKTLGTTLFILTFWTPFGINLGGNPTFLGPFIEELHVIIPFSSVGIILTFISLFIEKKLQIFSPKHLYTLIFLIIGAIPVFFSLHPTQSLLFLSIWGIGFLATTLENTFFIQGKTRYLWLISIVVGSTINILFPEANISSQLLGIASLLGIIFAMKEDFFRFRTLILLIYIWIIFSTQNIGMIIFTLMLFLMPKVWIPRNQRQQGAKQILFSILFLLFLIIGGYIANHFSTPWTIDMIPNFWKSIKQILFGIGEGQYIVAMHNFSNTLLIPQNIIPPSSSLIYTLSEKGIIGITSLISLILGSIHWFQKKEITFPLIIFTALALTSTLTATENGILFLMTFLFIQTPNKRKNLVKN